MPHSSFTARQRSKNPRVRSAFMDLSPYTQTQGGWQSMYQRAVQPPVTGAPSAGVAGVTTSTEGVGEAPGQQVLPVPMGGGTAPYSFGAGYAPGQTSYLGQIPANPFIAARYFGQQAPSGTGVPTMNLAAIMQAGTMAGETGVSEPLLRTAAMQQTPQGQVNLYHNMLRQQGVNLPINQDPDMAPAAMSIAQELMASDSPISVEALSALQRGYVPGFNELSAEWWQRANPVQRQAMLGLYAMTGGYGPSEMVPEAVLGEYERRTPD